MVKRQIRQAVLVLVSLTVITGVFYPLLVTGIAQVVFPWRANGSLLKRGNTVVGSELIGQPFSDPKYFWGRLSATSPFPYNAGASSGSNLGPLNPALLRGVKTRVDDLKAADPGNTHPIPVDLVTASGSGLDPHISVAAGLYQIPRVARARHMREEEVKQLMDHHTEGRQLGFLGEPRVNILMLNLALDATRTPEAN